MSKTNNNHATVFNIRLGDIEVDHKFNVRTKPDIAAEKGAKREDDQTSIASLAEHIRKYGCPPIVVCKQAGKGKRLYFLLAGFRRMTAMLEILKWGDDTVVSAMVHEALDDKSKLVQNLAENLQREDLHPAEQADGFSRLKKLGAESKEIAKQVGLSQSHVNNLLRLRDGISPKVWEAWKSGASERGTRYLVNEILPLPTHKEQEGRFFGTGTTAEAESGEVADSAESGPRTPSGISRQSIAEVDRAIQTAREALRDGDLSTEMKARYRALIVAWVWALDASKTCPIALPAKAKGRPKRASKSGEDEGDNEED